MSDQEINDGGPAFPKQPVYRAPGVGDIAIEQGGMSLRQYAAIKAMQGIVSCPEWQGFIGTHKGGKAWSNAVAEVAYTLADSMLKVGARHNPLVP